ncbi:3-hydroxyacyl-CoA dehydrogenase [Actinoplanes sp. TBRC 11911]|nr:3-hydroxyacyl-CoA dehydrogenase [Actinoplanes sp. TBRC 11911]
MIRYERDSGGVVTLTMDDPAQSANTMNATYVTAMSTALDRLEAERDTVTGVIVTSAKNTFFAGGDLPLMSRATPDDAPRLFTLLGTIKRDLRRLETYGRPVVAAINGAALGGGLEIALACHHRIALDAPGTRVGFPEVTLGLLPGAGGVTRTVRMLGLVPALTIWLLTGRRMRPADARENGLVDDVAATPEEMFAKARAWIAAHPHAHQSWDGESSPGTSPPGSLAAFPAVLRQQLKGASLPAPEAILATAVEGMQVDFETAQRIETRHLITLITGPVAKNMIGAMFFDMRAVNGGLARPRVEVREARRVAVLGAGMMGAGIAAACTRAGITVIVRDIRNVKLDGLATTTEIDDLRDCDVVIEAVFEDPDLKRAVFREVKPVLAPDALLASNTSTLPITGLAEDDPNFVGMHFFSPVAKMPLLEIVVGARTSDSAVARAFDLGRRLGKTPIVVGDGRGFFTSRVIGKFLDEAIAMLAEGVPAASIEHAALQAGYPTGPLALADEVSLTLMQRIQRQSGTRLPIVDELIDNGRPGRAGGAGFYVYDQGKRAGLWPGVTARATDAGRNVPFDDLRDRLLFAEAIDARRCLDEGVLRTEEDGNVGSILGIGYPAWTGGVLRFTKQPGFPASAAELATRYGERFAS